MEELTNKQKAALASKHVGKANEKRTEQYFIKQGALICTAPKSLMRFKTKEGREFMKSAQHDFFRLWDHIVVSQKVIVIDGYTILPQSTIYIQTKSQKQYGKQLLPYSNFPALWKFIFVWTKKSNGRYELEIQDLNIRNRYDTI